ncbi:MAG: tetratricopeptide repeat protein [Theionarchaea archaeon]|nr:tetratricopeptide repeat protein [Theionarchaea archaeon]
MRGMWLFCLCVFLLAQPPELLVVDSFESEGNWTPITSEGSTVRFISDRLNTREGESSLRIEAEFAESCRTKRCYGGITHEAPDLSGYAFLRLWVRSDSPTNADFGIYLVSADEIGYFYRIPLEKVGWIHVSAPFSEFYSEDQSGSIAPEDIAYIGLLLSSGEHTTVRVNVDELVALTDVNGNGVPDIDEGQMTEAAQNSEEFADKYFNEGDYEKAEKYYEEARSLYQRIGNEEKAQEMDSRSRESRAQLNYEQAEDFYEQKEYLKAMEAYNRARREFVLLGDADMIDTIEDRLKELSEITGKPVPPVSDVPAERTLQPQRQRGGGGLFFVLIVVVLVGVGVYLWKFRGRPEQEPEEGIPPVPLDSPEAKAEEVRKLKAKFVFGEINRQEYEKKLRELEDKT